MSNEDFSKQLAEIRLKLFKYNVSQRRLAGKCKMAYSYLNTLLKGTQRSISFDKFTKIKEAAEVLIKERTEEK